MENDEGATTKGRYYDACHVGKWATLKGFTAWMWENGYDGMGQLRTIDPSKPRTPDNCVIVHDSNCAWRMNKAEAKEFEHRWAKTVNPLRRVAGLPPLEVYG